VEDDLWRKKWRREGWIKATITLLVGVGLAVIVSLTYSPPLGGWFLAPFAGITGAYIGILQFEKGL
jgi:hypothetical protein